MSDIKELDAVLLLLKRVRHHQRKRYEKLARIDADTAIVLLESYLQKRVDNKPLPSERVS